MRDKNTLANVLKYIRSRNTLAGISLKPATPFKEIRAFAYNADVVLVMGVEPGASYQETSEETYRKVAEINKFKKDNNLNFKIEFDGGVNEKNAQKLRDLGVDILVSGSYVYTAKDREEAVRFLKGYEND